MDDLIAVILLFAFIAWLQSEPERECDPVSGCLVIDHSYP